MDWTVEACGPDAWLVRFGRELSEEVMARALSVSHSLEHHPPPGLREFTMGYASVLLEFDGGRPDAEGIRQFFCTGLIEKPASEGRRLEIPVIYDGVDLEEVAQRTGLTEGDVIRLHTGRDYRVWLLGFSPGFPYLGVLDEVLHLPRRETPRMRIGAGSVAIAGGQTGIYPSESAGGWHVIGRTPLKMFEPERTGGPFLLLAGDTVRFVAMEDGDV
jgi:KipI family sensor histidine kinase inhibitor